MERKSKRRAGPEPRVAYLSLGCDKNLVDTERALGGLCERGFAVVEAPAKAWALLINTCGFIGAAKEESVAAIMAGVRAREAGSYRLVAVVGCLVERYRKELAEEVPEVDLWLGREHVTELAPALERAWSEATGEARGAARADGLARHGRMIAPGSGCLARLVVSPRHYAFLKIAEGCNRACRFCAIPKIRGRLRSAPMDALLAEARALEGAGAKELNLVAQDTTAYGHDLRPRQELPDLIERLLAETAVPWLRVLYAHPANVTGRLIELLAHEPRLGRYLDLPLQHISAKVLAAMGRRPGRMGVLALLDRLAARVPGLVLRTTFLVGYPGETERDFEELLGLVREGRSLWAGAFAYSSEEGTAAAALPDQVPAEVAEERLSALFEAQREATASRLAGYVGQELTVLVDGPWTEFIEDEEEAEPDGLHWLARFSGQAVEVDGVVEVEGLAKAGEFVKVLITDSGDYDLIGRVIG
jgi:ribosomal protein S12 methylthiotransferase